MATRNSVSTNRLKSRRNELKNQRRWRDSISVIRTLLIMSLAGGMFWFLTLPEWIIKNSQQINISGNSLLTEDEIRRLITLQYPESLLQLSIEDLKNNLEKKLPLSNVTVTRQFIPPSLTITVEEKEPVAIAFAMKLSDKTKKAQLQHIGYIDEDGVFVSNEFYTNLKNKPELKPQLKIFGIPQTYIAYWTDFYTLLTQSKVKITEVDWQNPGNISLKTDLGRVFIGTYGSKFPQQLMTLEKMKNITSKVPKERIIYIDLTDPEMPSIKEKKPPKEEDNKEKKNGSF